MIHIWFASVAAAADRSMNCRLLMLACLAVFSVTDGEARPSVSGIYVAQSVDALTRLQLIEGSDGAVTGDLVELTVDESGRLHDDRATIAGVVEGSRLTLALSPASFSAIPTALSGIVQDDEIALFGAATGQGIAARVLRRGALREFDNASDRLRILSRARLEASRIADLNASQLHPVDTADRCGCGGEKAARIEQAEQLLIENAHTLLDGMTDLLAAADQHLKEFPSIAAQYASMTVQMRSDLERLTDLTSESNMQPSVGKHELIAALGRHGLLTPQLHAAIQASALAFRASASALATELDRSEAVCRARQPAVPSSAAPWNSLCARLLQSGARFRGVVVLLDEEIVGLESAYRGERERQAGFIAAADAFK